MSHFQFHFKTSLLKFETLPVSFEATIVFLDLLYIRSFWATQLNESPVKGKDVILPWKHLAIFMHFVDFNPVLLFNVQLSDGGS